MPAATSAGSIAARLGFEHPTCSSHRGCRRGRNSVDQISAPDESSSCWSRTTGIRRCATMTPRRAGRRRTPRPAAISPSPLRRRFPTICPRPATPRRASRESRRSPCSGRRSAARTAARTARRMPFRTVSANARYRLGLSLHGDRGELLPRKTSPAARRTDSDT